MHILDWHFYTLSSKTIKVAEEDILHPKGIAWIKASIEEIMKIFGCATTTEFQRKFYALMKSIGLKSRLSELGVTEEGLDLILEEGFNPQRIGNNPRKINHADLKKVLDKIW